MFRFNKLLRPSYFCSMMVFCMLLLGGAQEAHASHGQGTDIVYSCTGIPNQYNVTLSIYRDCRGVNLGTTARVSYSGCGVTGSITLNRQSLTDITPICPGDPTACDRGGGAFGSEQHVYTGTLTLPATLTGCNNILMSYSLCCRNNAITTLSSPGSESLYIDVLLDNSTTVCNNSPIFLNPPTAYTCAGNDVFYNHGAFDPDNDSLVYSLTPCLEARNNPVEYRFPFSHINPLTTSSGTTIDSNTGAISFSTPNTPQVSVLCVLVEEYRNGVRIGYMRRDMQFNLLNCTNQNPVASGVNGTSNYSITTCHSQQVCFNIAGSDPDAGDNVFMAWNGAIPGGTFATGASGATQTGIFCWTPGPANVGLNSFTVTINDDACPLLGTNTFTYTVNVINNPNDPVDAGPDVSICRGDQTTLNATTTATNVQSYAWSPTIGVQTPNSPTTVVTPVATTTYTVTTLYTDGCTSTDQVTVTVADDPSLSLAPNNVNVCAGSTLTLTATTDVGTNSFVWNDLNVAGLGVFTANGAAGNVTGNISSQPITMYTAAGTYAFSCEVTNTATGCTTTEILTLTIAVDNVPPACVNIYVSTTGTAAASGTIFDPTSLEEGVSRSSCNNSVIKVATGTYTIDQPLPITSIMTLEGGFNESDLWTKTSRAGATTIIRSNLNPGGVVNVDRNITAIQAFGASGFRLQDLTIRTVDATLAADGPGVSTYGIYLNGCQTYNITRCQIFPGNATNGQAGAAGCGLTAANTFLNGTAGVSGQDADGADPAANVFGGTGGDAGIACGSGAFIQGGAPTAVAGGDGTSATPGPFALPNVSIAPDGSGGGAGGAGGQGDNGFDGGASGVPGAPGPPNTGPSSSGSGAGSNVNGGTAGTVSGGAVTPTGIAPTAGTNGIDGINGSNGVNGANGIHLGGRYQVGAQAAFGEHGSAGSGGGGGGGSGGRLCVFPCTSGTGAGGGGGGGGAGAGAGGSGGFGGGASFGVYIASNGANGFIEHCTIATGTSGTGGIGGAGGAGGNGGAAGAGGAGAPGISPGGTGGTGGDGGDGGTGGNGATGIARAVFVDGASTIPVAQDSTYDLLNQQIIFVENVNCTNASVRFADSSTMSPGATAIPQIIPIGLPSTTVTNWTFDAVGLNTVPPTRGFNADTSAYNAIGRFSLTHNTCVGCPAAGGAAGNALSEYRGFHNIAFDKSFKPDIISNATLLNTDTFQLCEGDFAVFESSFFGDTIRWEFNGAITNPGNTQITASTQFNNTGFYLVELFLITDCCGDTPIDSAWLYVDPVPNATGSGDVNICQGETASLSLTGVGATDTIIWSPMTAMTMIRRDSVLVNPSATTTYTASIYTVTPVVGGGQRLSCPQSISFTVTIPDPATLAMTSTGVVCNNDGTATATITNFDATHTYDYIWANGRTTTGSTSNSNVIDSLIAGTYCVTVVDNDPVLGTSCPAVGCVVVAPAIATPQGFAQNTVAISCAGANDGQVTIGTLNGTAPYTYVWDAPVPVGANRTTSANYTVTGLAPRTYNVTVTDDVGCFNVFSFDIVTPLPLTINLLDSVNPTCQNTTDGSIEVEATGGTGLYIYTWSNGFSDTSGIISNIDTGLYTVTVTDANSCILTRDILLTPTRIVTTNATITSPAVCFEDSATITVNASVDSFGTTVPAALNYVWTGPCVNFFPTPTTQDIVTGACAGAYSVTVTDPFGCTTTETITVTQPNKVTVNVDNHTDVACRGDVSGTATVSFSGGNGGPATFLWSDGQTTATATGLAASVTPYCVTITDNTGCVGDTCITITEPATVVGLTITIDSTVKCNGGADGGLTANGTGGTPFTTGYTYAWDNGDATDTISGLAAGTYCVTITDSLGCTATLCETITEPTLLTATVTGSTDVACFGDSSGTATATGAGGTGAYTFLWSNTAAANTATATGLIAGNYTVTITDVNGCIATDNVTIGQPTAALAGSVTTIQNANCNGATDGAAFIAPTGGTAPYTYSWDNGSSNDTITNLTAGQYCVTVTDGNSCVLTDCVTITEPSTVTATIASSTDPSCFGDSTGTATVAGSGGNVPTAYTYLWSNNQTTATATGLAVGTHTVTVTDDSACVATATVTLIQPTQVVAITNVVSNYNGSQVSCADTCDAIIEATASGGTGVFTYDWGTSSNDTLFSACVGASTVTVTDANSCTVTSTATVVAPAAVTITVNSVANVNCNGGTTGSASVTASGGTGSVYAYSWDNGVTTATNPALAAGVYCVTATDVNNCLATACVTITEPTTVVSGIATLDTAVSCNGGSDADLSVAAIGGTPNSTIATGYTYIWDANTAGTVSTDSFATGYAAGTHCVTITDSLGCTAISCITVTEPTAVTATIAATTNVSCFGDSTGTATATAIGGTNTGTPPYNFVWSDGQTTGTATGLAANTIYTVTVTDTFACVAQTNVSLTQPATAVTVGAVVQTPHNGQQVSCNGASDGSAVAAGSGGVSGYTYAWDNGTTNDTLMNVGAGTYCVTTTDANGCTASTCVTITEPSVVVINTTAQSDVNCFGDSTGSATVLATGGTTPPVYTYAWSNGQGTRNLTNVVAGTYTVTATDANLCTVTANVVIGQPATAVTIASVVVDSNTSCNGLSDGGATVNVGGGTPAASGFVYSWSNGQNTQSLLAVPAGTYRITATDSLGCTDTSSVVITEPAAVTATIASSTNIDCFGDSSGTAMAMGAGGTAPSGYTFQWDAAASNQTTANATGLKANINYCVTVTDNNNCSDIVCITLTQPAFPVAVATITSTDVTCNGAGDGTVTATGSGGTGTYTFQWAANAGGATTATVTGLTAGNYCVTVSDVNGCTATACVNVNEPTAIALNMANVVDIDCKGDSTGEATIQATGGTGAYTYLWSANAGNSTVTNVSGLGAGRYCVTVTDAAGCQDSLCVVLTEPVQGFSINANVTSNYNGAQIQCFGDSSGTAMAMPTGGNGAISYTWSFGGITTAAAAGLPDGNFCVTATDATGCQDTACVTLVDPTRVVATITNSTNVSCTGNCSGTATVAATGGTGATYTYQWGVAAGSQITPTATGLCAGLYSVTVTDLNGCIGVTTVQIIEPANAIQASAAVTSNYNGFDVSCNTTNDGAATAAATGGTGAYTFQWNGAALGQTTATATGLSANINYCVTITDASGCQDSACVTLTAPTTVTPAIDTVINVSCFGDSTGCATASTTGGVAPYTYLWENGATAANICGLPAGSFLVTVTDANGCVNSAAAIITQPAGPLDVDAIVTSAYAGGTALQCFGDSSGTAQVTIADGTGPYTILWDNGTTTNNIGQLPDGTHCVTVTDASGCMDTACVTLTQPTAVTVSLVSSVNATCNGACDGSATVTANGGIAGYTYLWDAAAANQITARATGLCAGIYGVTATDANGCSTGFTVTITQPATAVVATATTVNNVSCAGGNDGIATGSAIGGTAPYTYSWSTGGLNDTIQNLAAGQVCVTITDVNGCADVACTTITQPAALTSTINNVVQINCNGDSTGSATAMGMGGTAPYMYAWDTDANSQMTATATGLPAGSFTVTITDAKNCITTNTVIISQPAGGLSVNASVTIPVQCAGDSSGAATVSIVGGSTPYSVLWDQGTTNNTVTGLPDGTYCVTVTDNNGCQDTACVTLAEPTPVVVSLVTVTDASCRGDNNGSATVTATGGSSPYTYTWDAAAAGQTGPTANNLGAGVYAVTATDDNGCNGTFSVTITEPATGVNATAVIVSNYNGEDVSCNGATDAMIVGTVTGGTGPYTYLWTNGTVNDTIMNIGAGQQCVTITDANGCAETACITVTQPTLLTATVATASSASCNGTCDGTATASANGGTAPFTFRWDAAANNRTTATINNLCAGSYNVTITDANGCQAVAIAVITQPTNRLDATVVVTSNYAGAQISCNGASDGEITASATGGTGIYTYNWLTNTSTTAVATGLSVAGNAHCVVVSDANGCMDTACVSLVEPTAVVASITNQRNVSCNGGNDGSATVTATGGTGAYTYLWDASANSQTTARANNLTAGSHCVTITDINGCQISTCVNITEPTLLTATAAIVSNYNGEDVSCAGANDGIVVVTPVGGTTGYTYTWSNAVTAISDTNTIAAAGTLTVTVTDANGCIATASVTLTEPNAVTATIASSVDATCNGACDGEATVAGTGGTITSGYTFNWSASANNQTTAIATGLCAGTHTVTVTDNNNCNSVTTVTIDQPLTGITASATVTSNYNGAEVSCVDACDGEATAVGAGGTPVYTYLWDANTGNQTTAIATGLCGDSTYIVTVTDAGGCANYATVTLAAPTAVTASVTSNTTVTCGGGNNAEATATAAGGTLTTGYTFDWSTTPTQNGATATGLSAGTYFVTATDNNGCFGIDSVVIIEPAVTLFVSTQVTSDYNGQDISCNTVCDGAGQVTISGGIPNYNILWSNGASTDSITNLCAGTYTVTVSDNGGCIIEDSIVIAEPAVLTATITNQANVSCLNGNDGRVTIAGTGGTPGYTYAIQAGNVQANNGTFTNLTAGNYTVTVTDLNFCATTVGVTITQPSSLPTVTAAVTSNYGNQDVSCFGSNDGQATATPIGGTAPYTYNWAAAGGQTTAVATGLSAGTYGVVITDAGGCTASATVTVTQPNQLTGSLTGTSNVVCAGDSTGTASFQIAGGTAPYTYAAGNSSTTTNNTTATINNIGAGGYNATITDANGCTVLVPFVITEPTRLTVTATVTSSYTNATVISCAGACDGAATAVGAGGQSFAPPGNTYQFLWSDGQTNFTATGLCAGTYTVEITDRNNCTDIDTVTLVEPTPLAINITNQTNVNCNGDSTGTATASISGGTPTYAYAWSNGQTNVTATGLAAGTYTVTATDGNNCTTVATVTITQSAVLATAIQITSNYNGQPVSCFNSADASVNVNVTGGLAPYNYVWSDVAAQTTATATGLTAGTYTVTVTDDLNCTTVGTIVITPPAAVNIGVVSTTNVDCFGQPTGQFTVAANGGVGPYLYSFDGGNTFTNTVTYTNLPANAAPGYQVIAQDANGCQDTIFQPITEPVQLQANVIAPTTQVSCFGGADGVISVTGVGGRLPYSYSFMGGSFDTTSSFVGLAAGTYTIEVRDSSGCATFIRNVVVTQPAELLLAVDTVISPLCTGDCNGSIVLSASQGTAGYEYSIDGITYQLSGTFSGLCSGGYTVFVRDAQGCIKKRQVAVSQPANLVANAAVASFYPPSPAIQQFNISCAGGNDGSATATPFGGTSATGTYTYTWSVGGQTTQTITGLVANTPYFVTVTDDNGCTDVDSVILTEPTLLTGRFTQVTNESCATNDDGVISVSVNTGTGVGPYTYDFGSGPSATINTMTGLTGALTGQNYSVTITDVNGCTVVLDTLLFEPDSLLITNFAATTNYNGFEVSCFNATDGAATVTTTGGTGTYTYLWLPNGATTSSVSGLAAGTYGVTVTDANGCQDTASVVLTAPTQLTMTTAVDSAGCSGTGTGGVSAIPSGSMAPYTYAIDSNGVVSPYGTDSTFTNLTAGTYTIYVQDANGCGPVSQTVNIGQDAPIVFTATVATPYNGQQVSCNGESDATASVTATGGSVGGLFFTYQWDAAANNQTGSVATGLGAGTYTVLITDTVSFCTETATVTVVEPTPVVVVVDTVVNVGCNNQATGATQVSATGGTPGYTYDIDAPGQVPNTTGIFTGLTAGTYNVTSTDANGCTATVALTVQNANAIVIDLDTTNISCFGNSDGIVTATVTGGTAGYTLTWNPLPAGNINGTDSIGQLPAGNYTLTVQDAAGCTATATATVVEPDSILVAIDDQNATCANSDGVIIINATGGPSETNGVTGNYLYSIDGGTTFGAQDTFRNLPSGFYDVVVRDASLQGCTGQTNVDLGTNSDVVTEITTTPQSCGGIGPDADGTATVTATSAAGGFTYVWTQQPSVVSPVISTTQTAANLNGNVVVNADGTRDTVSGFLYIVSVTDAAGCTAIDTAYVEKPDELNITASLLQDVSCYGGTDGMATVEVQGRATTAVTYAWSTLDTNNIVSTLDTVTNLSILPIGADSTQFIVIVTDSAGCRAADTVTVAQPEPIVVIMSGSTVNCVDSLDGIISIDSLSGGTALPTASGYEFGFELDGPYGSSSVLTQGLGAGIYTVYVRDANGCVDSAQNVIIRDTIDYVVTAFQDQTIDLGETVTLYGSVNSAGIDSSLVTWSALDPSTGIITQLGQGAGALEEFTPPVFYDNMTFILDLNNGCGDTAQVNIEVNKVRSVYVPNAFSPNGDGNNDVFTIYGSTDVSRIKKLMIFDRWGELVHEAEDFDPNSTSYGEGWDGTLRGKPMNPAVFIYYTEIEMVDGTVVVRKGDLTLVK